MEYNLFISYDLDAPGQNYDAVINRIASLGPWYKLQYSFFYVHTSFSIKMAHDHIRAVMDANDKLAVVDAKDAYVSLVPAADLEALRTEFAKAQAPSANR